VIPSDGHWKPTTCEVPDLAELRSNLVAEALLSKLFHSAGEDDSPSIRALRWGYLRLVDKCTFEYSLGRRRIELFVQGGSEDLIRAANHFETCIGSMARAVRYLEAFQNDLGVPTDVPVLNHADRIRLMRNAIEHTDEDIVQRKIGPGDPHILQLKQDEMTLRSVNISYEELASWIRDLHEQGHRVARHGAK